VLVLVWANHTMVVLIRYVIEPDGKQEWFSLSLGSFWNPMANSSLEESHGGFASSEDNDEPLRWEQSKEKTFGMRSRRETKRAWRIRRFEEAMHSLVSGERIYNHLLIYSWKIYLVLCSCFAVSKMRRWNFQNFELIKCLYRKVLQDISKFSIENCNIQVFVSV